MSRSYVTYDEWMASYGAEYAPGDDSIFSSSGEIVTFLEYITSLIETYAGQSFVTGVITHRFKAKPGQTSVYFKKFPLNSITSVQYYTPGTVSSPTTLSASDYMYFDDGRIVFANSLSGNAYYIIIANAGYTAVPDPIKQATMMLANSYAAALDNGAVGVPEGGNTTRFVFDKYEENYVDPRQRYDQANVGIPVTIMSILNRYRFLK